MKDLDRMGNRAKRNASAKVREHAEKLELLAKIGWGAKGALYVTLGILAVMAAFGEGGALHGSKGVLRWVSGEPFGQVLLGASGVGFICYALWRFIQAAVGPRTQGSGAKQIARRIGSVVSGAIHVSLGVAAFQMLLGGDSSSSKGTWLAKIMSAGTWGQVVVGLLGAIIIGVGLFQFKRAAKLGFMEDVDQRQMSSKELGLLRWVGRAGHAARGVVFPLIGYFLIASAYNHNPSQAKGVGGALSELAQTSWIALAVIALGLTAYGVLNLLYARYRRFPLPSRTP